MFDRDPAEVSLVAVEGVPPTEVAGVQAENAAVQQAQLLAKPVPGVLDGVDARRVPGDEDVGEAAGEVVRHGCTGLRVGEPEVPLLHECGFPSGFGDRNSTTCTLKLTFTV